MKLTPFVSALWLLWLSAIVAKISIGKTPSAIKRVAALSARSVIVILGTTAARMAANECPDPSEAASAFLAAVSVVALSLIHI